MPVINIIDKEKAEQLHALGFLYATISLCEREVYQFVLTDALQEKVCQTFAQGDYFVSKHACFEEVDS